MEEGIEGKMDASTWIVFDLTLIVTRTINSYAVDTPLFSRWPFQIQLLYVLHGWMSAFSP